MKGWWCKCWLMRIYYGLCSIKINRILRLTANLLLEPCNLFIWLFLMSALCRVIIGLWCWAGKTQMTLGPGPWLKVQYQEWKPHSSAGPHEQPQTRTQPQPVAWNNRTHGALVLNDSSDKWKPIVATLSSLQTVLKWSTEIIQACLTEWTIPPIGPDVPLTRNSSMERESNNGQHPSCSALTEWNVDFLNISYISTFVRRDSWVVYIEGIVMLWLTTVEAKGILVISYIKWPLLSHLIWSLHFSTFPKCGTFFCHK